MVVQAYILIQTDVGKAAEVAAEIAEVKGVTLAEDVTGPYDVIVRAEARNVDELGKLVVARVQNSAGNPRTLPCPVVNICGATAPRHGARLDRGRAPSHVCSCRWRCSHCWAAARAPSRWTTPRR
jgi:DNA-binding Lrp family transcriptional regulator